MKRLKISVVCILLSFLTACGNNADIFDSQQAEEIKTSESSQVQTEQTAPENEETSLPEPDTETVSEEIAETETTVVTEPPVTELPAAIPPPTEPPVTEPPAPEYTVSYADWADVQWTQYECLNFTLMIPQGWEVQWQGDAEYMWWYVKCPYNSMLGVSNTDHGYAAKDASMTEALGMSMAMSNGTVQEFFETFYSNSTDYFTVLNSVAPANSDEIIRLNPSMHGIRDYKACYAIYQAAVMDNPDIYIRGQNYASWYINAIFTAYAPRGELVNWLPVLTQIVNSFRYTDYYLQQKLYLTGMYLSETSSVDTNSVVESFEERMTQDEIIQAKTSDMIGEYERVYDNDTGEIYRAYDGFLDDIGSDQTKYSRITDSQYAEGYVGWIDK